jgi:hypothetical protein
VAKDAIVVNCKWAVEGIIDLSGLRKFKNTTAEF